MLSAPTSTAPEASMRSTSVASREAGERSRLIFDPARVGNPLTSNRFFTANGTPASGPGFFPAARAASMARARARARSATTSVNAFRTGLCAAIRASAASTAASADIFREETACAISEAEGQPSSACIAGSGCKDTGRLGFIGQREFVDEPREPQRDCEIGMHGGLPCVFDRQRERFGGGLDVVVEIIGRTHNASSPLVDRQRRMRNRREQLFCIVVLRIAEHALGRALLDDSPRPHHNDTIA